MEISLEEIQKKFESLPEDLKWAIMATKVDDNIINIGQANSLNVEQMGQLSLETYMVMFGFVAPEKFEASLKGSLKLPEEKIHALVNAVNEKILKEIRAKMMAGPAAAAPAPTKTSKENEKKDTQILGAAGIKIVPEKPELNAPKPTSTQGNKEEHPILAQKLTGYTKTEVVKTEHTLENITKNSEAPAKPAGPGATPNAYPKNADPYRLPPE